MAEQWFSIVEYARTYKVSDMTVRRRIKTGKLHAVLKEGKYFIPVQAESERRSVSQPQSHQAQQLHQQSQRRPGEMSVVKSHPSAHATYASLASSPADSLMNHVSHQPAQIRNAAPLDDAPDSAVPPSLARPLAAQDTSLVDTRALLAFCEASLRRLNDSERRTVERFKSKLEAVEATLLARDHEIKALRQQVEDLQLLVKILERK